MADTKYQKGDDEPCLYIFMRTDMDSLNAGKGMAQAAHAANQMVERVRSIKEKASKTGGGGSYVKWLLHQWQKQGASFGTTIVLNGDDLTFVKTVIAIMEDNSDLKQWWHGTVLDETYPIKDGRVTHFLPIETCMWVFGDKTDPTMKAHVDGFSLHD